MNQHKRQLSSSSSTDSLENFRIPHKKKDSKPTPTKAKSAASAASTASPIKAEVMDQGDNTSLGELEDLDNGGLENLENMVKGDLNLEDVNKTTDDTNSGAGPNLGAGTNGANGGATANSGANGGTTWAEAAAGPKKVKKDYPFTLYVQQGVTKREPITKAHFTAFEKHLWKERFKLQPEDNAKIIIDFIVHNQGYGVVACTTRESAQWVKKVAAGFRFGTIHTRAWARWERSEAWIFSGFLQGSCYKDPEMKAKYVLSTILKWNGFQGNFEIITWSPAPNGVFISFEPKGILAAKLSQVTRLNGGNCVLHLEKRLRKARTEEQFLEWTQKREEEEIQRQAKAASRRGASAAAADR